MGALDKLRRDVRGAVTTEYVVLVGAVGLALMFCIVALGPNLVANYEATRKIIASPYP
jgi:Flp pilus assembly pilin Flp